MIELVLGGARSGKSRYAERQATLSGLPVIYLATGEADDDEMQARIEHHRQRRPAEWRTVEEPMALGDAIRTYASPETCLLVDCLTLWLSNVLFDDKGQLQLPLFKQERAALLDTLATCRHHIILVSNEVGQGVVAADPMTRRFVDEAGFLHQELAQLCDKVILVSAGLPLQLK